MEACQRGNQLLWNDQCSPWVPVGLSPQLKFFLVRSSPVPQETKNRSKGAPSQRCSIVVCQRQFR